MRKVYLPNRSSHHLLHLFRWRKHYKAGMYAANVAAVNGANGYGYDHTSAYGGSVAIKGKDLEEQVSHESGHI